MSLFKRIFNNIFWYGTSELINAIALLVFTVLIGQYFSVEIFGKFNFALMVVTSLGVFVELGLTTLIARESALKRREKNRYLKISLIARIISVLFVVAVLLAFNSLTNQDPETRRLTYILLFYVIFFHLNNSFFSFFRAFEKTAFTALSRFFSSSLLVAGTYYLIQSGAGITRTAVVYSGSALLGLMVSAIAFTKLKTKEKQRKIDREFISFVAKQAWPLALSTILIYIYYFTDSIIIGLIKGDEAVGYYNIAYKVLFSALLVITFLYSAIFPIAVKKAYQDKKTFHEIIKRSFAYIFNFSLLFFVLIFLYGQNYLNLFFGDKFDASVTTMKVLASNGIVLSISILFGHLLLDVLRKQKLNTIASSIGATLNIVLNIILIYKYSFLGAAIATIATEIVVLILLLFFTRTIKKPPLLAVVLKSILISGLVLFVFGYLLPSLNFILGSILVVGFTLLFLFVFSIIKKEDLVLIKSVFKS